jgi:glycerol-3-phosphate acyltransferase PlsY
LPVLLARAIGASAKTVAAVAVAAIVGHVYSVFLHFRGGKGVATGFGVLLGLAPAASIVPLGIFAAVVAATRIVSLASLCAAASAPLVVWAAGYAAPAVAAAVVIALLIAWKHQENISRLLTGSESRFQAKT